MNRIRGKKGGGKSLYRKKRGLFSLERGLGEKAGGSSFSRGEKK